MSKTHPNTNAHTQSHTRYIFRFSALMLAIVNLYALQGWMINYTLAIRLRGALRGEDENVFNPLETDTKLVDILHTNTNFQVT